MDINKLELWRAAGIIERQLNAKGVARIELGNDSAEFEDLHKQTGKKELGEHFRRTITILPPNRFKWLAAFDADKNVIGIIASRFDDVEGWSLRRYIKEFWERSFVTDKGMPVKINRRSTRFADEIQGPFVYIGESYVVNKWRRKGISSGLAKLLVLVVQDDWQPGLIYGWMRPKHVATGMHVKYGFTDAYQAGLIFDQPPFQQDHRDLYFMCCREAAIHQMVFSLLRAESQSALSKDIET